MLAAYKISLIVVFGLMLVYAFQGYYPESMHVFSDVASLATAAIGAAASSFCLRKYRHKLREAFSLIWLFFAVGMVLWFFGQLIWVIHEHFLGVEVPYPSIADISWLIGYIPLFAGMALYVRIYRSLLTQRIAMLAAAIVIILGAFVLVVLIPPIAETQADFVTKFVDFAYPLSDLALLSVSILGLLIFLKGALGKSWLLFSGGILSNVFGDILFSFATIQGIYYCGHPIGLLYVIAYVSFALGFYVHSTEI